MGPVCRLRSVGWQLALSEPFVTQWPCCSVCLEQLSPPPNLRVRQVRPVPHWSLGLQDRPSVQTQTAAQVTFFGRHGPQ